MLQTDRQTDRYVSIQLIRIIACLGVFSVHFGQRTNLSGYIRTITDYGRYGVQLFFIISGFLAAKGLNNRNITPPKYYIKRAIHILPLYYFSIIWFFVTENILNCFINQIPTDTAKLGWVRYIFFLNGFVNSDTYFWSNLGITWTIPIFVVFYLSAPYALRKILTFKYACILSVGIFLLTKVIGHFYRCKVIEYIWIFYIGVIIYYAVAYKHELGVCLSFQVLAIINVLFDKSDYAYIVLLASITILSVSLEGALSLSQKIKNVIDYIDARTYTLYLVHGIVFCSLIDRLDYFGVSNWMKGVIAIILSISGTVVVYRFYEKPIQKLLLQKVNSKSNSKM